MQLAGSKLANAAPSHYAPAARRVAVVRDVPGYSEVAPYSPLQSFPEYPLAAETLASVPNPAYGAVRTALRVYGLDGQRFGTPGWNPLSPMVKPGQTVLIKPNFVRNFRETKEGHGNCLVTHGAVIRALVDYAFIALRGRGRLIIADAPQNDADFTALQQMASLAEMRELYRRFADFNLEFYDLRPECAEKIDGVIVGHKPLTGDPAGYRRVEVGANSAFHQLEGECHRLYGSEYDTEELRQQHVNGKHAYLVSQSVLDADLVINLPKLKTHKKCGLTACLKNLVGINGNKNFLPHYRIGSRDGGGDEFERAGFHRNLERTVMLHFRRWFPLLGRHRQRLAGPIKTLGKRIFGDTNAGTVRSGNWHGNDTVWRTVLDLNRILLYADRSGQLGRTTPRRVFNLVDGIVGGEGDGPLNADPRQAGLIIAGANPVAVDLVCAELIGFDPQRMPIIARAFDEHPLPLATFQPQDIVLQTVSTGSDHVVAGWPYAPLHFAPHFGWTGHVERSARKESA
jgi:uncharacterized protein (DUF362 family)